MKNRVVTLLIAASLLLIPVPVMADTVAESDGLVTISDITGGCSYTASVKVTCHVLAESAIEGTDWISMPATLVDDELAEEEFGLWDKVVAFFMGIFD